MGPINGGPVSVKGWMRFYRNIALCIFQIFLLVEMEEERNLKNNCLRIHRSVFLKYSCIKPSGYNKCCRRQQTLLNIYMDVKVAPSEKEHIRKLGSWRCKGIGEPVKGCSLQGP